MHKILTGIVALAGLSIVGATALSIPEEQLNNQKLYWGNPNDFEKPGEVYYHTIIRATPEYQEISQKRIQRGTGQYWILMSQASDRALHTIAKVGRESTFDLIAARGYLGSLDPPILAEDITELVIEVMNDQER